MQQQVTGGRKAPYLIIEPLSPIVGIVVGSLLAVHPLASGGEDPCGQFATDAQVGRVGHPPLNPEFVGRLHGVVILIIRGTAVVALLTKRLEVVDKVFGSNVHVDVMNRCHGTV